MELSIPVVNDRIWAETACAYRGTAAASTIMISRSI